MLVKRQRPRAALRQIVAHLGQAEIPGVFIRQFPQDDRRDTPGFQNLVEEILVFTRARRVALGDGAGKSLVIDIQLGDINIEQPAADHFDVIAHELVVARNVRLEMTLQPDSVEPQAGVEHCVNELQQARPDRLAVGIVILAMRLVENKLGGRINRRDTAEGALDIGRPHRGEPRPVAKTAVLAVLGPERFVDHVPGMQLAGIARHHGFDMLVEHPLGLAARQMAQPVGRILVPHQRMAAHRQAVFLGEGEQAVGALEIIFFARRAQRVEFEREVGRHHAGLAGVKCGAGRV